MRKLLLIGMLLATLIVIGCAAEEKTEAAETVKETDVEWRYTHTYTDADTITDVEERSNGEQLAVEVGVEQNIVQFSDFINLKLAVTKDTLRSGLDDGWTVYVVVSNAKPLIDLRKDKE